MGWVLFVVYYDGLRHERDDVINGDGMLRRYPTKPLQIKMVRAFTANPFTGDAFYRAKPPIFHEHTNGKPRVTQGGNFYVD